MQLRDLSELESSERLTNRDEITVRVRRARAGVCEGQMGRRGACPRASAQSRAATFLDPMGEDTREMNVCASTP